MKSGTKISIFQRDNCIYPPNYRSHLTRQPPLQSLPWKPQILPKIHAPYHSKQNAHITTLHITRH